jgi:hypothetical protein
LRASAEGDRRRRANQVLSRAHSHQRLVGIEALDGAEVGRLLSVLTNASTRSASTDSAGSGGRPARFWPFPDCRAPM